MKGWTAAFERIREAGATPNCANEFCTARGWRLWSRRGNGILLNGKWCCGEACLREALLPLIAAGPRGTEAANGSAHRLPLGLLMLARGIIDEHQLKIALELQGKHPEMKIGECLGSLGAVSGPEITRALGAQHCLPVLLALQPDIDHALPMTLMQACRCVGFRGNYHPGLLYVGFDGAVDRPLLAAAESVLGRQCEPCVVESRVVDEYLERGRRERNPDEIVFDSKSSAAEMVRSVHSYAQQSGAEAIRVARTLEHLWVRLSGARQTNLLFRLG